MAERYIRIYMLPETDLYETGSPLLICVGALLKDTQTGRIIAQLKFRNIGAKRIKAVRVSVRAFDPFGTELEGIPEFQYLDLSADRDAEFGQKTAIILPNADTRSFTCACSGVIFADGTVWTTGTEDLKPLIGQKTLSEQFGDLADQYRRDTFKDAKYMPATDRDLWRCACGAINRDDESICHGCGMKRSDLTEAADVEQLKAHDEAYRRQLAEQAEAARIEAERKAEAARIEAERKAEEARKEAERKAEEARIAKEQAVKKRKKTRAIVLPIVIACIAFVIVLITVIIPNQKYNAAVELYNAGKYEEAIAAFTALDGYKDSAEQIVNSKYSIATELYNAGKYEEAIAAYTALDGYKDSEEQILSCKYIEATELYDAGKYEEAITAFAALNTYKDSTAQIEKCKTAIKDQDYAIAMRLYIAHQYEDAIAAYIALDGYKDSAAQIEKCETAIKDEKYAYAVELYKAAKYGDAIAAFSELDGYKDSAAKVKEIKKIFSDASVGSTVLFGSYYQKNRWSGKEAIEWIVLAKSGHKLLLISKYALSSGKYDNIYNNKYNAKITWETSDTREWLNGTFLNEAFSEAEQRLIRDTLVTADKNPEYSTSPGNNTTDKVFLLSIAEANKYFTSDAARRCVTTDYADAVPYIQYGQTFCSWWLRTPGMDSNRAACVSGEGSISYWGREVDYFWENFFTGKLYYIGIRPALWIDVG